jgi:hypothetical protein
MADSFATLFRKQVLAINLVGSAFLMCAGIRFVGSSGAQAFKVLCIDLAVY